MSEPNRTRILVTGSRAWEDPEVIWLLLDHYARQASEHGRLLTVVHGAARRGADLLVSRWVLRQGKNWGAAQEAHPAYWNAACVTDCRHGPRPTRSDGSDYCSYAGHRRNARMVSLGAGLCLAFMRAESSGTRDCANRAL